MNQRLRPLKDQLSFIRRQKEHIIRELEILKQMDPNENALIIYLINRLERLTQEQDEIRIALEKVIESLLA